MIRPPIYTSLIQKLKTNRIILKLPPRAFKEGTRIKFGINFKLFTKFYGIKSKNELEK